MTHHAFHIGLNAQLLSLSRSYRGAGISWYIFNLLQRLPAVSPDFRYTAFLHDRAFSQPSLNLEFTRFPTHRPMARILWEQTVLPWLLQKKQVDLLHALAFVAPLAGPRPWVVTVYDLSFLRYPEAFRPFNRWYLKTFTARSVQRARAVIAISESTRQDVIHLLKVPAERVHTVYCGVDSQFRPLPPAEVETFRVTRGLPETFILFLGTLEPRKNVAGLLKAYARWKQTEPDAPPLVIAGGKGWYYEQIFALVETLGLADSVHFPGYIPQEELVLWYNAATIFVYPSHFEGFGLPVLEAMACGTPVITSTAASLPEVAGTDGAAWLVDPADTEALTDALLSLYRQPDRRAAMAQAGRRRAARFNWQTTAQQTVDVYRKVLSP